MEYIQEMLHTASPAQVVTVHITVKGLGRFHRRHCVIQNALWVNVFYGTLFGQPGVKSFYM